MDWRKPAIVLALAVVVAGCGSQVDGTSEQVDTSSQGDATSDAEAWLAQDGNSVVLLRWTENETNQISGVLQVAELVDYEVEGQSLPIDGVVGDEEITLSVEGFLQAVSTVTGDYSNGELTLYWPQSDGSMGAVVFHRGTIDDYNDAVDALRQSGLDAAAWQQQAEYEADAIAQADSRVTSARTSLERAIGKFEDDQAWAGYSIDSVDYALDSLEDAVLQLEDTLETAPEYADADLDWAESSFAYLEDEADYALGAQGLGVIEGSITNLASHVRELQAAIDNLRDVEDIYLGSEFAPYDISVESDLIEQAQGIVDDDGPAALSEHRRQVDQRLAEGADLIEHARSLVG